MLSMEAKWSFESSQKKISKLSLTPAERKKTGSGALFDKMLLVRIVENYEIYDYLGLVRLAWPCRDRKRIRG